MPPVMIPFSTFKTIHSLILHISNFSHKTDTCTKIGSPAPAESNIIIDWLHEVFSPKHHPVMRICSRKPIAMKLDSEQEKGTFYQRG